MKLLLNTVLGFLLLLSANSFAQEVPLENFFKFFQADQLKLSPTGDYIAVRAEVNGRKQVYILDRKTNKITQSFTFKTNNDEAGSFFWANDERLIVSMVRKIGALDQPAFTGFYFAGNADGKRKMQLWPPKSKAGGKRKSPPKRFRVIDTLDEEPKYVLAHMYDGSKAGIYRVNIFTSSYELIEAAPKKRGGLILDRSKQARLYFYRDRSDFDRQDVYLKNSQGEWEFFKSFNASKGGISPIDFTVDNKKVIAFYDSEKEPSGIYSLDVDTKELELLHELKGDADVERYIYDFKYNDPEFVGVIRQKDFPAAEFIDFDNDKAKLQASFEAAFPDKYVSIGEPTKDGKLAIITVRSDKDPGQFYLFDNETGKLSFQMAARPWIDEKQMATRYPIKFKARDGLEIRGYLTLPNGKQKDLPMVLLVHGGPYGPKDSWFWDGESQFLANRGYAVLQVNYRGSGGRGREFQYGAYRQMGKEMQDDLTDATLWAIENGFADKNRICIYGGSYGGYAALMGVIKEPDLYQCAIGYAGAYDIAVQRDESDTATIKAGRKFLDEAWNAYNEDFVRERSPVYHVDKITAALMLVHGRDDPRTPIEGYNVLTDALDKVGHPYESMVKPNEGHGFYDRENAYEFYSMMEQFLKKHIGIKKDVIIKRVEAD